MNCFEKWYCGSALWRYLTRGQLLPWMLRDSHLGDQLLELGAGLGAATIEVGRRVARVTSLEYDHALAVQICRRANLANVTIIQDATRQLSLFLTLPSHPRSPSLCCIT